MMTFNSRVSLFSFLRWSDNWGEWDIEVTHHFSAVVNLWFSIQLYSFIKLNAAVFKCVSDCSIFLIFFFNEYKMCLIFSEYFWYNSYACLFLSFICLEPLFLSFYPRSWSLLMIMCISWKQQKDEFYFKSNLLICVFSLGTEIVNIKGYYWSLYINSCYFVVLWYFLRLLLIICSGILYSLYTLGYAKFSINT